MAEVFKRPELPLVMQKDHKRARIDERSLVAVDEPRTEGIARKSNLHCPIMLLTGHEGEIYTARFSLDGNILASAGLDMRIFLWNVYGECENFSTITGHKGAIMDLHFNTDTSFLYTCSTDKTIRVWDMDSGVCLRRIRSHTDFVNSCHPARRGPDLVCSGSDDGTVQIHDIRKKEPLMSFENRNKYQVTAVTFNDTAELIISGGIDNTLTVWDIRRKDLLYVMPGHSDTITGLCLSPDGKYCISNSMDCTARVWDIRPYSNSQRCVKLLSGHQHNFEKNLLKCGWSPDNHRVTCGSSDRFVYIWDVASKNIAYKLPGHQGSINAVDFHPKEPIILSAGSDKRIFLGELSY